MYPLKFEPILKQTLWGGDKIIPFKHLNDTLANVGESWEVSAVEGSESIVANGADKGLTLPDMVRKYKEVSSSFGHIFSGGYAAGYYGYKWAEVLDADAFSVFKATGIFNTETARSFRENILSKGGTEDPAILYKRFRGQEPTIDALLIRNGIKQAEPKANSN